jgi:hypothetical protein
MTPTKIVKQALLQPRGTFKVVAALGELLTASSMFDLWMYQCLKGSLDIDPATIERAGRRSGQIASELTHAWTKFMSATEATEDHIVASAELIPVLRSLARELREFLGEINFYDDDVLSPILGMLPHPSSST